MTTITASMVQDLRARTNAGMMDCKKALTETNGDMEAAVDWLRKKGLSAAAKKAGRTAAEGLVAVAVSADGRTGAVVEVNAETDFVGRNEAFQTFVATLAQLALDCGSMDALLSTPYTGKSHAVQDELTSLIATIGENMTVRRMQRLQVAQGVVVAYVHGALIPHVGKIGTLVALDSTGDAAALAGLGKQLAMHVAAAKPEALSIQDVDTTALEREKAIFSDQARASGKPDAIIEKMVEGRVRKYYDEVVLLAQTYVMDGETRIETVIANAAKDIGAPVSLSAFARFQVGEGIEKEESDFAAEVAKMAG